MWWETRFVPIFWITYFVTGTISASGAAADIKNDHRIRQAYLGI